MTTQLQTVLITGASSGIGWDFAHLFARDHFRVILTGRNEARLHELSQQLTQNYQAKCFVIGKDLGQPNAAQELFDDLQKQSLTIDVLVNNAGFGGFGAFAEQSADMQLAMLQLNMVSLTQLTKLFLPHMLEQKNGRILNVASVAAFLPGPYMALYYATKAYVLSFSSALSEELRGSGLTCTCLCPGPTATHFFHNAGNDHGLGPASLRMSSAAVARIGYRAMQRGQAVVIAGWMNTLQTWMLRFTPRSWIVKFIAKLQKTKTLAL